MLDQTILQAPFQLLQHLDVVWTFVLLAARYIGLILVIPGIGMGSRGITIRLPAAFALAFATMSVTAPVPLPPDPVQMCVSITSELLLGTVIGLIPQLIVSGAQMAGQLTSSTMGLAAANLIDPTLGTSITPIGLLLGDLTTIVFLLVGGHHVAIYVASGLAGQIPPGQIIPPELTAQLLIDRSAYVFQAGVILSAPVVVALLLTQFVMGLISKAVPSVNIFIVSFPLTIGIGLVLTILSLPMVLFSISHEMTGIETVLMTLAKGLMPH